VAKNTGRELDCQPERCMICENGCLLDVVEKTDKSSPVRRHLFCLMGVENPEECVYHLVRKIGKGK